MMLKKKFVEVSEKNVPVLKQYVPIVNRVHGGHHPEMNEVKELFEGMLSKINQAGESTKDLEEYFLKLRGVTDHYKVPEDVCESYEAVYRLLEEMDKAYDSERE